MTKERWDYFKKRAPFVVTTFVLCIMGAYLYKELDPSYDYIHQIALFHSCPTIPNRLFCHFPEDMRELDGLKKDEDLDAMRYFKYLNHLKMEDGYILDWVYYKDMHGNHPVLYSRKIDDAPYRYYTEYAQARRDTPSLFPPKDYLERVVVDGTKEGFIQLAVLYIMGGQFFQEWHACYNDCTPICNMYNKIELLSLMDKNDPFLRMPVISRLEACTLSTHPRVTVSESTVRVDVLTFSCWGGFERYQFQFMKGYPHRCVRFCRKPEVPYDCGVLF